MEDLTHEIIQDFAKHDNNARFEATLAELRQISNLMMENSRLKRELDLIEKRITLYMLEKEEYHLKFKNQQEKHRVDHTVTVIDKFLNVIGINDAIEDISVLKEMARNIEVDDE